MNKSLTRRAALLALAGAAIGLASGCTAAKYQDCYYISILEKKSLNVQASSDTLTLTFNKDADPAVEMFKQGVAAGAAAVAGGGGL